MSKDKIEHVDILGQPLAEGNYVAISKGNSMYICQIKKITPRMMRASPIRGYGSRGYGSSGDGWLIYSQNSVLLSGTDATAYILKYSGKS